jgi:Xaa-Pro aminopeptidase
MSLTNQKLFSFKERRNELISLVQQQHKDVSSGKILLFANFERDGYFYKQDSSFYYFTGLEEPAAVLCLDLATSQSMLFVPNFGKERAKWVAEAIEPDKEKAHALGFDAIEYLGKPCVGYQCHPFFTQPEYENFLRLVQEWLSKGEKVFTLNPTNASEYIEQRFVLQRIASTIPTFEHSLINISGLVAQLRRKKSKGEIEQLYKAIAITIDAQEAAINMLQIGKKEYEIQAAIEYHFIAGGGSAAFPSIVASGKNSTILHYMHNTKTLVSGDLVVIDIGARYNNYCADITRTYPVSGTFTQRQREIYTLVLETQEYIANIAKPGLWLSNKNHPDKSLNHLAKKFLEDRGYGHYFPHGIGHFLGLDVHDVGDSAEPLQVGDIITIEPGIYIPDESIGVRIEDDYWIVPDGVICLSENLPKQPDDIEEAIAQSRQFDNEQDEEGEA